ncbi:MAG TPA: protein translocase subunit SecF, partial [Acidimicrobiales bacterium]|nr:protein translocase subunit SecF [Acidimicrobiales bacterium]
MAGRGGAFGRLYRGETSFDFAGRWRRWFAISGTIIIIGLLSLGIRGMNFSIDFKGGTVWQVPTTASVQQVRAAAEKVDPKLSQATIQVLTSRSTNQRTVQVAGAASTTNSSQTVKDVAAALAKVAHVNPNAVNINAIGPSWGADITNKAIKAVIIFLIVVSAYIWFRFEGKMAVAALTALVHDILITVGIYSLSGLAVSPDTVIAFLTILGYSLYDTIVVFDKVQENTRGVASSNRLTYTETVNLSMNQVLARSLNTSFVAIIPILSILVIGSGILGAAALNDFGLALFIGLTTGAYSSIFIASPLLALLKEREPRYAEIRHRIGGGAPRRLSPRAAAAGGDAVAAGSRRRPAASAPAASASTPAPVPAAGGGDRPVPARPGRRPGPPVRRPAASRSGGGSAPSATGSTATGTAPAGRASAAPSDWSTGVDDETDTGDGRDAFLE